MLTKTELENQGLVSFARVLLVCLTRPCRCYSFFSSFVGRQSPSSKPVFWILRCKSCLAFEVSTHPSHWVVQAAANRPFRSQPRAPLGGCQSSPSLVLVLPCTSRCCVINPSPPQPCYTVRESLFCMYLHRGCAQRRPHHLLPAADPSCSAPTTLRSGRCPLPCATTRSRASLVAGPSPSVSPHPPNETFRSSVGPLATNTPDTRCQSPAQAHPRDHQNKCVVEMCQSMEHPG